MWALKKKYPPPFQKGTWVDVNDNIVLDFTNCPGRNITTKKT